MMVYNIGINSCLKIPIDEGGLKVGQRYDFEKDGERLYPLRVPIELINDKWEILGKIIIRELTIGENKTKGIYEVLRIYDAKTKKVFTENVIRYDKIK